MELWEFKVDKPEDLEPFADFLEEKGHPGGGLVRWLVSNKKFPQRLEMLSDVFWQWIPHARGKGAHNLPMGALCNGDYHNYFSTTEAIWALINAEIHRKKNWYE